MSIRKSCICGCFASLYICTEIVNHVIKKIWGVLLVVSVFFLTHSIISIHDFNIGLTDCVDNGNQCSKLTVHSASCTALTVYRSTILPIIDYNDHFQLLWNKYKLDRLQKFQNRGLRIIFQDEQPGLDEDVLHELAKVMPLKNRRILHLLGVMYHRSKADKYLDKREVPTRQFDKIKFIVPHPNIKKAFKTPNYFCAQLWDLLPDDTQRAGLFNEFKSKTKRHITAGLFDRV